MDKIENSSVKLFLTSGITLTATDKDTITMPNDYGYDYECDLDEFYEHLEMKLDNKMSVKFDMSIDNELKDGEVQVITHSYNIPYDRISWVMREQV